MTKKDDMFGKIIINWPKEVLHLSGSRYSIYLSTQACSYCGLASDLRKCFTMRRFTNQRHVVLHIFESCSGPLFSTICKPYDGLREYSAWIILTSLRCTRRSAAVYCIRSHIYITGTNLQTTLLPSTAFSSSSSQTAATVTSPTFRSTSTTKSTTIRSTTVPTLWTVDTFRPPFTHTIWWPTPSTPSTSSSQSTTIALLPTALHQTRNNSNNKSYAGQ